jgi:hypothetical protein
MTPERTAFIDEHLTLSVSKANLSRGTIEGRCGSRTQGRRCVAAERSRGPLRASPGCSSSFLRESGDPTRPGSGRVTRKPEVIPKCTVKSALRKVRVLECPVRRSFRNHRLDAARALQSVFRLDPTNIACIQGSAWGLTWGAFQYL